MASSIPLKLMYVYSIWQCSCNYQGITSGKVTLHEDNWSYDSNLLNPLAPQLWETIHQTESWGGLHRQRRQNTSVRYALSLLSRFLPPGWLQFAVLTGVIGRCFCEFQDENGANIRSGVSLILSDTYIFLHQFSAANQLKSICNVQHHCKTHLK